MQLSRWKKLLLIIAVPFLAFFYFATIYIPQMRTKNDNFPFTKVDYSSWDPSLRSKFEAKSEFNFYKIFFLFRGVMAILVVLLANIMTQITISSYLFAITILAMIQWARLKISLLQKDKIVLIKLLNFLIE
jgi:hypothetical protein